LQELERLSQKFGENVLDATKKFEKIITDKKDIEGLPATSLGLAAQTAVSKVLHVIIAASWFHSSSLINCFLLYIIISGAYRCIC
jgi:Zn-dependent oligopeptidase